MRCLGYDLELLNLIESVSEGFPSYSFILFSRAMRKLVTDVKVIPGEEVELQHQLLVCDMRLDVPPKPKRKLTPRLKGEITSRRFSSCM